MAKLGSPWHPGAEETAPEVATSASSSAEVDASCCLTLLLAEVSSSDAIFVSSGETSRILGSRFRRRFPYFQANGRSGQVAHIVNDSRSYPVIGNLRTLGHFWGVEKDASRERGNTAEPRCSNEKSVYLLSDNSDLN